MVTVLRFYLHLTRFWYTCIYLYGSILYRKSIWLCI